MVFFNRIRIIKIPANRVKQDTIVWQTLQHTPIRYVLLVTTVQQVLSMIRSLSVNQERSITSRVRTSVIGVDSVFEELVLNVFFVNENLECKTTFSSKI